MIGDLKVQAADRLRSLKEKVRHGDGGLGGGGVVGVCAVINSWLCLCMVVVVVVVVGGGGGDILFPTFWPSCRPFAMVSFLLFLIHSFAPPPPVLLSQAGARVGGLLDKWNDFQNS